MELSWEKAHGAAYMPLWNDFAKKPEVVANRCPLRESAKAEDRILSSRGPHSMALHCNALGLSASVRENGDREFVGSGEGQLSNVTLCL